MPLIFGIFTILTQTDLQKRSFLVYYSLMERFTIVVATAFGIESVTKRELLSFGIDAPCIGGRFSFEGNFDLVMKLNMFLRTAERVFIRLGHFSACSFDELFDNVRALELKTFLTKNGKITIKAKCVDSALHALSATESVTKKAIVENLKKAYNTSVLPESSEDYRLEISIRNDFADLLLDTSGAGLHKRGYRSLAYTAPLKETLAAALIDLSVWNDSKTLIDPFCGSGTIPLEAAMKALRIAPGKNREFAFDAFPYIPEKSKKELRELALSTEERDKKLAVLGFDIDEKAISESLFHAKKLGVADKIHFQRADVKDLKSSSSYGVIITNPPYGERLLSPKEVRGIYVDFAKVFTSLDNFSAYVLTAMPDFARITKLKPNKERKLFNGKIECRYYTILGQKPPKKP